MELWIRSQDENSLVKCSNLRCLPKGDKWYIMQDNFILGEYNNRAYCLEILGEIQIILSKVVITYTKGITQEEVDKIYKDLHTKGLVCLPNNAEFKSVDIDTFVYQMPKE